MFSYFKVMNIVIVCPRLCHGGAERMGAFGLMALLRNGIKWLWIQMSQRILIVI